MKLVKVISGGQTGVDRAALDAALTSTVSCGGWCPAGRWAEDGPIPEHYPLLETPEPSPDIRTRRNVEEANGTLIITLGSWDEGTLATKTAAEMLSRPLCAIDLTETTPDQAIAMIKTWIRTERIGILNIAGPRESNAPGIYHRAQGLFTMLFAALFADPDDVPEQPV
jgi:hypothetical protein